MAFSVITHTAKGASGSADFVTTDAVDTTGANLIVVAGAYYAGASASVTDSKSNTWSSLTPINSDGASNYSVIFYSSSPTTGSGHTFTFSSTSSFPSTYVIALSGAKSSLPFDVQNGAAGNLVTTLQPGSVTPSEDNELLISATSTQSPITFSINSSFTIQDQLAYSVGNYIGGALSYKIQTTAGAENPTWSWDGTLIRLVSTIATFKAAAVGGGSTIFIPRHAMLMGMGQ